MNTQTIFMCVVALLIGMLVANMLQNVCVCKKVEGFGNRNSRSNPPSYPEEGGGIDRSFFDDTAPDMSNIDKFVVNNQGSGQENTCGGNAVAKVSASLYRSSRCRKGIS